MTTDGISTVSHLSQSRESSHEKTQKLQELNQRICIVVSALWASVTLISVGVGATLGVSVGLVTAAILSVLVWKVQMEGQRIFSNALRAQKKRRPPPKTSLATSQSFSVPDPSQSDLVHVSREFPKKTLAMLADVRTAIQRSDRRRSSKREELFSDTSSMESYVGREDVLGQLKQAYHEMKKSEWNPIRHRPLECREKCKNPEEKPSVYFSTRSVADGREYLSTNGLTSFILGEGMITLPEKITEFPPCRPQHGGKVPKILVSPHRLESVLSIYFAELVGKPPLVWVLGNLSAFLWNVQQFEFGGLLESFFLRSTLSVMEENLQPLKQIPQEGGIFLPIKIFRRSEELGYAFCAPYEVNFFVTPEKEEKSLSGRKFFEEALKRLLRFAFAKGMKRIVINLECNPGLKDEVLLGSLKAIISQEEFHFSPEIYLLLSKGQWERLSKEKLFHSFCEKGLLSANEFSFASDPLDPLR